MIYGFLNRDAALFTTAQGGSTDQVLAAMNDARRSAQRLHDFELNRIEECYLTTSLGGAAWTTGCKTAPGGATAVLMKRIDEVWTYTSTLVGATTYYPRAARIPFSYSGEFKRQLYPVVPFTSNQTTQVTDNFAYAVGPNLFVTNATAATTYKLVGIKWLDDLTGSEDPDIFLTYFTDWFKYATLASLNKFLKDTEQVQIDEMTMRTLWESVKSMDGTIANMGESANLD